MPRYEADKKKLIITKKTKIIIINITIMATLQFNINKFSNTGDHVSKPCA